MGRLAFLLLIASTVGVCMANANWQYGWGSPQHNPYRQKLAGNKIIVGGSSNWTFGFNYARWAFKHGVFFVNDTLVFRYDPPSENNTHPHSVYLLPDYRSYKKCDLASATKLANESQGAGDGFEFVLQKRQLYYFACGASNGFHCNNGTMKFFVFPHIRGWF